VHSNISPLTTTDGKTTKFIYSAKDITEQRRLEAEALKIKKLEANATLAGGIAHDFNNLLQIILGYVSLAKQNCTAGSKASELLALAEKNSWRASQLSQQLLIFAKGGSADLQTTPLGQLITSSIESALHKTNIEALFDLPEDIPRVHMDATQMKHVFSHLAVNAFEAMPAGGTLRVAARSCVISPTDGLPLAAGQYVHITFSDTGIGVAPEDLGRIFDPYFTTKETWNKKGLGLGLAICNSVIQKHNGIITADSKLGNGTIFHIYLPTIETPEAS
jgi:signal transduction histidine kinase